MKPKRILCAAFLLLCMAASAAETITVGGVGSLTPLVKRLADEYMTRHPGIQIAVVEPPLGSKGGLRALAAGKIQVAVAGRGVNADEAGRASPWLQTPLVLATHGGASRGLTRAQLAAIYAGRATQWDDGKPIRLVLRGDQETETQVLRSMAPDIDAAVTAALGRSGLPIAENDIEALDLLGKIAGSLGTSNLGLIKSAGARLDLLPIDGVAPSTKALGDGSYPWRRQFHLITLPGATPAVSAFAAWLQSPPALALARRFDYLPLSRP